MTAPPIMASTVSGPLLTFNVRAMPGSSRSPLRRLFAAAASQIGPQRHAWLHYMNDEVPGTLTGYDGKKPSYTLKHNYNQTGRAGTPQQQPDRYYPAWHVNSRHYKGQFEVTSLFKAS